MAAAIATTSDNNEQQTTSTGTAWWVFAPTKDFSERPVFIGAHTRGKRLEF